MGGRVKEGEMEREGWRDGEKEFVACTILCAGQDRRGVELVVPQGQLLFGRPVVAIAGCHGDQGPILGRHWLAKRRRGQG